MYGEGIIKGMAETAKNFVKSYSDPERLTTVQYPEERLPMTQATRNFPFLVFDNDPEKGLRCVACKICEKECPPQCIYIILERDEKGKPKKAPRVFDIDISVCMSCQICVEVCPFDAIKMDQVYELSRTDRFDGLLLKKTDLRKSNEYYRQIHPDEAAEVDARLDEEKAKAAAKAAAASAPKAPAATPATSPPTTKPAPTKPVESTVATSGGTGASMSPAPSPRPSPSRGEGEAKPPLGETTAVASSQTFGVAEASLTPLGKPGSTSAANSNQTRSIDSGAATASPSPLEGEGWGEGAASKPQIVPPSTTHDPKAA